MKITMSWMDELYYIITAPVIKQFGVNALLSKDLWLQVIELMADELTTKNSILFEKYKI